MEEVTEQLKYYSIDSHSRLAYRDVGVGRQTLVFLHGMGSSQKAWKKNITVLRNDFRCVTLDLPGYGYSDTLKEPYSIPAIAGVIIDFLKAMDLHSVILVGHSMGGHASMEIARRVPERIQKLILLAQAGLEVFPPQEVELVKQHFTADLISSYPRAMIKKNFELNFFSMPDDARFMIEDRYRLKEDREAYLQFCQTVSESTLAIISYNMLDKLEAIAQPTIICYGKNDNLIPHHLIHPDKRIEDITQAAMEKLSNAALILYSHCGHFLQWEKAEEINKTIKEFCE